MSLVALKKEMENLANPERALVSQRYFKTGKGEYGEGDVFLGLSTPSLRGLAKKYIDLSFTDIDVLLRDEIHEYRSLGLFILVYQFQKGSLEGQKEIYEFYMDHLFAVNNWDLVDTSTPYIVGKYLLDKKRDVLYGLVISENLWERRVAILATFAFLKEGDFTDTLKISELLLGDKHDLIHKATGWMLREVGKKDEKVLCGFLDKHCLRMPRTMLRYAIERLPEKKRQYYLKLK